MTLKNFAGSVAVVTGGASGIGLATARALYAQGAHVVLADINGEGLQQAAQLVHQSNPSSTAHIVAAVTDVADEEKVRELMRQALDTCGRIDLVVCSAGIGRGGLIDDFSATEMLTMMNINFMGIYHCVQAALPSMRHQQSGHFVFLSSVAGKLGSPYLSGYCATKWAVRGFSIALRAELHGTGIGITTVYPAWVDTPMIHQENDDIQNMTIVALLTPEQVADEILQAVLEEKRDLTLAPNPDIALTLEIMKEDPDKAEILVGESFRQRIEQLATQQTG